MNPRRYSIGVDFGTESARAVLVDVRRRTRVRRRGPRRTATASSTRACRRRTTTSSSGPIGRSRTRMTTCETFRTGRPAGWSIERASTRPRSSASASTSPPARCCPTTADGTPLCLLEPYRRDPHAWVKLWKHHAAQPEADDINAVAARARSSRGSRATAAGSRPSGSSRRRSRSCARRPRSTRAADRLIEAADWVVWQLTGVETRNSCTAGYKALWSTPTTGSRTRRSSRRSNPASAPSSTTRCRARSRRSASGRRPDRGGGRRGRACAPGSPSRSPTSTPTSRCRPRP